MVDHQGLHGWQCVVLYWSWLRGSSGVRELRLWQYPRRGYCQLWRADVGDGVSMNPSISTQFPELPEPSAWVSLNVLTQKASVGKLPITSLQPGVYQNTKVFSEDQMHAYASAAVSAHEAEVARLRLDAERYQWLRKSHPDDDAGSVVSK